MQNLPILEGLYWLKNNGTVHLEVVFLNSYFTMHNNFWYPERMASTQVLDLRREGA